MAGETALTLIYENKWRDAFAKAFLEERVFLVCGETGDETSNPVAFSVDRG